MSHFVVSARKYRPVRFDEVVGQQHISGTLKNALQNDHLAHAFLFCGPRGVGKTTCARILAKVINCQDVTPDFEPCNTCNSCQAFNDNASFNITELDAASNNSVEHIRALIEQVRFQPQQGKYKVFIIDEVHMLSQQAFNAFLKTLEEPPPYAIFILATTEKHKIIPTILSRCQIYDFRRIQIPDTVAHLQGICQTEGIAASPDALHIIAQKADGALRDALSIFDRIVSFSGKQIRYEDVIENLHVLDYDYFFRMTDAILMQDVSQAMLLFDDVLRKGFEGDLFLNGLAEHFRNLLVCRDPATHSLLELSEGLLERYRVQSALTPPTLLLTALNIANETDIHYKTARNKRLHLEMALIKMTHILRAKAWFAGEMPTPQAAPQASLEKKTPDLSNPALKPAPEPLPKESPAPEVKLKPEQAPEPARPVSQKADTPRLSMNLDAVLSNKMKAAHSEIREEGPVLLSPESLQTAWNAYAQTVQSESVRHILQNAELELKEHILEIVVASRFAENAVQQELGLMDFLRTELKTANLKREIRIDESKAPQRPESARKKVLSVREKYLQMRELNPHIDDFFKRFNLKPEND
jgi:DNA polymerase-3 subunit gamma/tau